MYAIMTPLVIWYKVLRSRDGTSPSPLGVIPLETAQVSLRGIPLHVEPGMLVGAGHGTLLGEIHDALLPVFVLESWREHEPRRPFLRSGVDGRDGASPPPPLSVWMGKATHLIVEPNCIKCRRDQDQWGDFLSYDI